MINIFLGRLTEIKKYFRNLFHEIKNKLIFLEFVCAIFGFAMERACMYWKSRRLGTLCLAVFLFVVVGCKPKEKKKEEPPIPIEVGAVKRGDMKEVLRFTGDLEGEAQVQVFSIFPERIKQMRVDVGDLVKKGQVLAVIEHTRLRQVVAQARAQVAGVRSQLAGAKVTLAGAKVAASSARREYRRLKRLLRGGAVGAQQVDMAKTQYESALTRVQAARAQARALKAQIRALRSAVAQARTAKSNAIVRAPIGGLVARRYRQMGDMATPQLPLVTLVRMDKVKVNVQLTEKDLARVKIGKAATIRVAGHPDRSFVGRVVKVAPTLDLDTRTAPARLEIDNIYFQKPLQRCKKATDCRSGRYVTCQKISRRRSACAEVHPLKPGMIGQVEILVKTYRSALMMPARALLNDSFGDGSKRSQKNLAVMVLEGGVPRRRNVQVGLENRAGMMLVRSGLKEGEKILLNGHNFYRKGAKIKVVKDWSKPSKSSRASTPSASSGTSSPSASASN